MATSLCRGVMVENIAYPVKATEPEEGYDVFIEDAFGRILSVEEIVRALNDGALKASPEPSNAAPQAGQELSPSAIVASAAGPAVAAPDVAAMVKRLRAAVAEMDSREWYVATVLMLEAAALIEKLAEQKCIK